MTFDPDNPQVWFTWAVLSGALDGFEPDNPHLPWSAVRYIAQDSGALWWGYNHKPLLDAYDWISDHDKYDDAMMRCIGNAPPQCAWDKRYYEVNHDI